MVNQAYLFWRPWIHYFMRVMQRDVSFYKNSFLAKLTIVAMKIGTLCIFKVIIYKVNSVQEACDKCFSVHILKFEILQITWKKWNKEHQTLSFQFLSLNLAFWCFCFVFSCGLQDFKFQYVNCKAFGASFLYWVDFNEKVPENDES